MSFAKSEADELATARILIVEDEGIVAKDLQRSLRGLGYAVTGLSSSGLDALEKAEALRPDLVLMDVRLQGEMDGIDAARALRERIDVPVVFLTAYADPDTLARAATIGPFGYVLKPFAERELQIAIIMAMCKHRAFAELDRRVQERSAQLAQSEARFWRLQTIVELGVYALATPDTNAVIRRATELVAETLDVETASVQELQPDGRSPLLRALHRREETSREGRADGETSCASVLIHPAGPSGQPFGVLEARCKAGRPFSQADVSFLQAVGNVIAAAIMRSADEVKIREAERTAEVARVRAEIAEEALRARDEFLSVASHELRTPVAALQLQLQTLVETLALQARSVGPRVVEKVERAAGTTGRLASLVEGVLDVSRIALGKLELLREDLDLTALTRDVVLRHEDLALRSGCVLRLASDAGEIKGRWDRVRVEQIVTNLLSNALKFGAGKPIDVTLERLGQHVRLSVRDQGEGLDPVHAERIMRRFERAVSHRHYGGLGLGLYIAGQIAEAHGGRIEVKSRPKEGALFTVVLPCDVSAADVSSSASPCQQ